MASSTPGREGRGAESIGYDPERAGYLTLYFGSARQSYEATVEEGAGTLVWKMRSETTRFSGTFSPDGNVITGHWGLLQEDSKWRPWMDITLTKQAG